MAVLIAINQGNIGNLFLNGSVALFSYSTYIAAVMQLIALPFISLFQIGNVLTCGNFTLVLLWIITGFLVYYIKNMSREVNQFIMHFSKYSVFYFTLHHVRTCGQQFTQDNTFYVNPDSSL